MSLSRWEIDERDRKAKVALTRREQARRINSERREAEAEAKRLGVAVDEYLDMVR
jgi:hypothetical protein